MLGERPAGAPHIAAPPQPRVERVQHRAADLPQLHPAQRRTDRAPDVPLVGVPRRDVQLRDLQVLDQQLADRDPAIGPLPIGRLLQQAAQGDLRLLLGPNRLPVPQPAARQRVRADVDMHPVGAARQ